MRARILLDNGKFADYKGPAPVKAKVVSEAEKLKERAALDETADEGGFKAENPVVGGLSKADKELVKAGMSLMDLVNLANTRKMKVPKDMDSVEAISKFLIGEEAEAGSLSDEDKEKVLAGMSIPEMRKLAKDAGIKIPADKKKAVDIKSFLLQDEEDDL